MLLKLKQIIVNYSSDLQKIFDFVETFDMDDHKKTQVKKCFVTFHLELLRKEIIIFFSENKNSKHERIFKQLLNIIDTNLKNFKK